MFKYFAKSILFFLIYLLVELIILHKLYRGSKAFLDMKPPVVSTGLSSNPNIDINKNNNSVKSFMVIIYGLFMALVLIWCVYKIQFRMPDFVRAYKHRSPPDDTLDKRFQYDCTVTDPYEEESGNSFFKVFMQSDMLNEGLLNHFEKNTKGVKKPSMISGLILKMGEYGERLNKNMPDFVTDFINKKR
jgi:hypothetical protein